MLFEGSSLLISECTSNTIGDERCGILLY